MTSAKQSFNNVTKQTHFMFEENIASSLSCDFYGSSPPPILHIIRGEVDITPLFIRTERVEVLGEPGLQYVMYHIQLKQTKMRLTKQHDKLSLYCTAQVPTFTDLSLTRTATIDVFCEYCFNVNLFIMTFGVIHSILYKDNWFSFSPCLHL